MSSEPSRPVDSDLDPISNELAAETVREPTPPKPADPSHQPPPPLDAPTVDHLKNSPESVVDPDEAAGTIPASPTEAQRSANLSTFAGRHHLGEFPGYEVLGQLGRGGMGLVYQARQTTLDRIVAIKVVQEDRADPKTLSRFMAEARAVAAIKHPNVLEVYHYGEHAGCPYMVLEYCSKGTLAARLKTDGSLPPDAAASLLEKIALGVAAAHAQGIVHRDLKPGNILFDETGEPKVADFGLAKLAVGAGVTIAGDVMGTPAYMAPEQAGGASNTAGPPCDVWALGVLFYECLTGTRPFDGHSTPEVLASVQSQEPTPLHQLAPTIPWDLAFICLKCLRKEPNERYATAAELAQELRRFLNGEALGGRRREWGYRVKKTLIRRRAHIGIALALVVAFASVWFVARRNPETAEARPEQEDPALKVRRGEVLRRVETLTRFRPQPDDVPPHRFTQVPEVVRPDMSAFQLAYDDRVVDLRGWRPIEPGKPEVKCFVLNNIRQVLTKIRPVNILRAEARTTGRDVHIRAIAPNPNAAELFVADRADHVGGQVMKVRQVAIDVADVPVGTDFTVQTRSTFWDSLQTEPDRWFGVVGFEGSVLTSMLMLFPDDRPFTSYTLRVAPTRNESPVPYTGPVVTFEADDRRWLYWEIPYPKAGHVYRIDWKW